MLSSTLRVLRPLRSPFANFYRSVGSELSPKFDGVQRIKAASALWLATGDQFGTKTSNRRVQIAVKQYKAKRESIDKAILNNQSIAPRHLWINTSGKKKNMKLKKKPALKLKKKTLKKKSVANTTAKKKKKTVAKRKTSNLPYRLRKGGYRAFFHAMLSSGMVPNHPRKRRSKHVKKLWDESRGAKTLALRIKRGLALAEMAEKKQSARKKPVPSARTLVKRSARTAVSNSSKKNKKNVVRRKTGKRVAKKMKKSSTKKQPTSSLIATLDEVLRDSKEVLPFNKFRDAIMKKHSLKPSQALNQRMHRLWLMSLTQRSLTHAQQISWAEGLIGKAARRSAKKTKK